MAATAGTIDDDDEQTTVNVDDCEEVAPTDINDVDEVTDWTVDGTPLTEHAGQRMDERDFTDQDITDILAADPDGVFQPERGTTIHSDGKGNHVVTRPEDGAVVTVYGDGPGGFKVP